MIPTFFFGLDCLGSRGSIASRTLRAFLTTVTPMSRKQTIEQIKDTQPIRRRFRPDSWLSVEDANLLLRKRAKREAKQGNYAAAIEILNQLTAYEPKHAENFVNRGLMHYNLKHYDQALADYDRAIDLDPDLDKAYSNRANLHAAQENWMDAIDDYDEAIDLNPLNIRARLNQAITLREMGGYTEALTCLDLAMFFHPQSATLYAERGRTYQLMGQWNCALADYRTAQQLIATDTKDISDAMRVRGRVLRWMHSLR